MLLDLLREKKCFKLICGAGNDDAMEVEKLIALYSKAGCSFFDISANPEVVGAAKRGLKRAVIFEDRYLCCSVGLKDDPHVNKVEINPDTCILCGVCTKGCPQNAIFQGINSFEINKTRCIGCSKCLMACPTGSITLQSEQKDFKEVLPPIISQGIDCIEFHISGKEDIKDKWEEINSLFDGVLSICISRTKFGDEEVIERVSELLKTRKPYTTIIQADGAPMSGGRDDYKTTLQTVACAEIFQKAELSAYIILSGGTNSKSTELAKLCGVEVNGVAIGSFARKIVREYIDRDDFFENEEVFNKALEIAKNLVSVSLGNLG